MSGRGRGRGRGGGPVQSIVKGISSGIGLAAETYYHSKDKKRAKEEAKAAEERGEGGDTTFPSAGVSSPATQDQQADERAWALDETEQPQTQGQPLTEENLEALAASFVNAHPPPYVGSEYVTAYAGGMRLALPVIVPQRRPKARDRGFVRCYSPVLADVGIDEATFLDFIDKLNAAVRPSPWLEALNLAGMAALGLPEPMLMLVHYGVMKATDAVKAVQSRTKSNAFMKRLNADFFRPRGLVCLIITWQPEAADALTTTTDFSGQVADAVNAKQQSTFKKMMNSMQPPSPDAYVWPDVAPLVFPAEQKSDSDAKKSAMKRAGNFVGDYYDKRATAEWAGANPGNNIANMAPPPTFQSRYADPNHPASNGNIVSLLTGGAVTPETFGITRGGRGASQGGRGGTQQRGRGGSQRPGGLPFGPLSMMSGARKLLQKDVVYLLIANLPSEEELAQAAEIIKQYEVQSKGR